MKKVIALALALMMVFALCACGGSAAGTNPPATDSPATEAPTEDTRPTQEPAEPSDGSALTSFYEAVIAKYEFPGMVLAEGDMLENFYPGLSSLEGVEEFQVYTPMMTGSPSELTMVKLSDPSAADAVKAVFDARVAACTKDGDNYPETIEAWKNNCRQVTSGDYMLLVVHTDSDAIAADFEAAVK